MSEIKIAYKILTQSEWGEFIQEMVFEGSDVDFEDGFIHLSAESQVQETLHKHFEGGGALIIVKLSLERPELEVRWEEARNGEKFPHAYADLSMDDVLSYRTVLPDRNGRFVFETS